MQRCIEERMRTGDRSEASQGPGVLRRIACRPAPNTDPPQGPNRMCGRSAMLDTPQQASGLLFELRGGGHVSS
jgi:hypothetical protein